MTANKMLLLYMFTVVLQAGVTAQQASAVASQKKVPLQSLKGFSQQVFYSTRHEKRANEIATCSDKAVVYFNSLFGFKPSTKLYILAQADWKDYASPIVYGMPHYPDSSRLVIAAEDNDLWRSFLPPVDKLPPPLAAKVKGKKRGG